MKEIINIIFKRNSENQIVTPDDIVRITNILESIYEIDFNGVKFKCGEVNSIYYDINENIIVIDYEKFFRGSLVAFNNYRMLFSLAHELRHVKQYTLSLLDSSIISKIYLDSFDYLSKKNFIVSIFYAKNHDAFPIEINADLVGYLLVMYVAFMIGDKIYYGLYKNMFERRIMNFTEFNFDVLKSICGTDILEYLNEIDEYELFINGLIRNKEKALDLASSLVIM